MKSNRRPAFGLLIYFAFTLVLGVYFTYSSVRGDFGLLRRIEIEAEVRQLSRELAALENDVEAQSNRAKRLSDEYLDLDLLDEQTREILGLVRADEVILR